MLKITCDCGAKLKLPDEHLGRMSACPRCQLILRAISAGGDISGFPCRLVILEGPERVGEQFLLGGEGTIDIGKSDAVLIRLASPLVSRNHCRLIPSIDGGWTLEDTNSTNGVGINDVAIQCQTLRDNDRIRIGEYLLVFRRESDNAPQPLLSHATLSQAQGFSPESTTASDDLIPVETESEAGLYDLAQEPELAPPPPRTVMRAPALAAPPLPSAPQRVIPIDMPGPKCPSCAKTLPAGAKICIACGIDIKTGRAIVTSRGLDEDSLAEHAGIWIRFISWIFPFPFLNVGVLPIASEAYGTKKPYIVWSITALTVLVSLAYLPLFHKIQRGESEDGISLLLWSGSREKTTENVQEKLFALRQSVHQDLVDQRGGRHSTEQERRAEREFNEKMQQYLQASIPPPKARFHWYQLFTSGLLHAGFFHLAGNLLFMLIFGWRVNELVGNVKMLVIYPILMAASAGAYFIMSMDNPLAPYLGASGAIMGLAGMYFVLFPAQKVHMIAWFRILVLRGWKIFRMRGFWMLLLWIGLNDVLPTLLGRKDHVAHWAHLGGFVAGAFIAILLLLTRQISARGTDLLSFFLGKRAWSLLGKPTQLATT